MNANRIVNRFCFRLFCTLQLISCFKLIFLFQIGKLLRRSSILIVNIFFLYIFVKQKQTKNNKGFDFDNIFSVISLSPVYSGSVWVLLVYLVMFTLVQREYCRLLSSVYSGSAWVLLVYLVLFTLVQREYCWLLSSVYSGWAWVLLVYLVLFTLVQRESCRFTESCSAWVLLVYSVLFSVSIVGLLSPVQREYC